MNRALTQDECRDQRTLFKILERNKLNEWLGGTDFYVQLIRNLDAMQQTGTTDGEELAELTDEDARERPWVMCEFGTLYGPYTLISAPPTSRGYVVISKEGVIVNYDRARRATENELKQAGITQ
jgi:hypothetical protein